MIVEQGPHADAAGAGIDAVVDELELADVRIAVLADEADVDRRVQRAGRTAEAREGLLVAVEARVDRVRRHDGRQHDGRVNQVADRDLGLRDPAGDRCPDLREGEVELREVGRGPRGAGVGIELLGIGEALVEVALRDRVVGQQPLRALELRLREFDLGDGAGGRGTRAIGLGAIGTRIDDEEPSPFFTTAPGTKRTAWIVPETRGRMSAWSTASMRPENSWVSTTSRSTAAATLTGAAGGADDAAVWASVSVQAAKANGARPPGQQREAGMPAGSGSGCSAGGEPR